MNPKNKIESGEALLIDVRSPKEFSQEHFKSAQNIPIEDIEAGEVALPKDKPIFLHCKLGPRAERALKALKAQGYEDVYSLGSYEKAQELGLDQ